MTTFGAWLSDFNLCWVHSGLVRTIAMHINIRDKIKRYVNL